MVLRIQIRNLVCEVLDIVRGAHGKVVQRRCKARSLMSSKTERCSAPLLPKTTSGRARPRGQRPFV